MDNEEIFIVSGLIFVAILILIIVVVVQIGIDNSCKCTPNKTQPYIVIYET